MSVDWDTLTITCSWRALVGRVFAEELRVDAYRASTLEAMMTKVKEIPGEGMDRIQAVFHLLGNSFQGPYEAVRKERLGYTDKHGDERLKQERAAISWRLLEEEDNEDVEDDEDDEDYEE
jgi:hypothetical protein